MRARFRTVVVVLAITLVLFGLLEGGVRLLNPQNVRVVELDQETLAVPDSVLGHRYRPDTRAVIQGPEFKTEYAINEQGLRDAAVYGLRTPGVTRILLLGDSFAFGAGVDYEDTWAVVMEQQLRNEGHAVEVVKAGMVGFDTRTEVLFLERIFSQFDPDLVMVALLPNDLFTNRPIDDPQPSEDTVRKPLVLHSVVLLKRLLAGSDDLYIKTYLGTERREYFLEEPEDLFTRQFEITRKLLRRGREFVTGHGVPLVVLSIPQQFQVLYQAGGKEIAGVDPHAVDLAFSDAAMEAGYTWIPTLDALSSAYRESGDPLYFRFDGHLNARGCAVLGRHAAAVLSEMLSNQ